MTKIISLLIFITLIGCCVKEEPHPIELPESKIFLSTDDEVLYDLSYSACNQTPSSSETIGSDPVLILFSPGIFHAKDSVNIPNDLDFYFIFHDVPVEYFGDPTLNEFWSYLQLNIYEFNTNPYKRDFFLKIKRGEKIFQNWWNGNLLNIPFDISRDETNLKFHDYEFSKFNEFGEICLHDYSVLRLKGEINGILVTEDYSDTINVNGNIDIFLNFRE